MDCSLRFGLPPAVPGLSDQGRRPPARAPPLDMETPTGPYSRTLPRALWRTLGGAKFLMGGVPLQSTLRDAEPTPARLPFPYPATLTIFMLLCCCRPSLPAKLADLQHEPPS